VQCAQQSLAQAGGNLAGCRAFEIGATQLLKPILRLDRHGFELGFVQFHPETWS
jgi:hypothetical protein